MGVDVRHVCSKRLRSLCHWAQLRAVGPVIVCHQEQFGHTGLPRRAATARDDKGTCCADFQEKDNKHGYQAANAKRFAARDRCMGFMNERVVAKNDS